MMGFFLYRLIFLQTVWSLDLSEVLDSVEKHFPSVLQAHEEYVAAEFERKAALDAFDLRLKAEVSENDGYPKVSYRLGSISTQVYQTPLEVKLEWDRAQPLGFPPYQGEFNTGSDGRWKFGARLPLLRDFFIDPQRARLERLEFKVGSAKEAFRIRMMEVYAAAATHYWQWQMTIQNLKIAEDLVKAAEANQKFIDQRVRKGDAANIESVENQKILAQRLGQVIGLKFEAQEASNQLSFYLRDPEGNPKNPPELSSVRWLEEKIGNLDLQIDWNVIRQELPFLKKAEQDLEAIKVEKRLAYWSQFPRADLVLERGQYLGALPTGRTNAWDNYIGVQFSFLLFNFGARNNYLRFSRLTQAQEFELKLKTNEYEIKVLNLLQEIQALAELIKQIRIELAANEKVLEAEKKRFILGGSSLFIVNLREVELANSRIKLSQTLWKYHVKKMLFDLLHNRWVRKF